MTPSVAVTADGHVALLEIRRGPNNYFDAELLHDLSSALFEIERDPQNRVIVLCSEGKHFCAGAQLGDASPSMIREVYRRGFALFTGRLPIVVAVQGAAVGGGLGLALAGDFRVAGPKARFSANFARLGFHHGFGISVTLPRVVGNQTASEMLYTGRTVGAEEATQLSLCDRYTDADPRDEAVEFARNLALSAPLSLVAIRSTMRRELVAQVYTALSHEADAQIALLPTDDFAEGISAAASRRDPTFHGS
jgi:enoyl-CoA hydratase/carnithine racemase